MFVSRGFTLGKRLAPEGRNKKRPASCSTPPGLFVTRRLDPRLARSRRGLHSYAPPGLSGAGAWDLPAQAALALFDAVLAVAFGFAELLEAAGLHLAAAAGLPHEH